MKDFSKNITLWAAVVLAALFIYQLIGKAEQPAKATEVTYSEFLDMVEAGSVSQVNIQGNTLLANPKSDAPIKARAPYDPELISDLRSKGVNIKAEEPAEPNNWVLMLMSWAPWIIFIGIWVYFMRKMQGGAGKAFSFGRSKAKMLSEASEKKTFADVAGVDEAKQELEEIVDFLKEPTKFTKLGGRIPKGVLLVGQPGTGKTLLARAVAGEAGVPFFSISGSDFVEMFVGVGAARVRDLFEQGKRNAPCIVFIDEIDAVGRHRGAGLGGGNDEREQTLNAMLVEMDGFESNEGVIIVAATNRPDVLDPALLRPGRFDRQVVVPLPDIKGRTEILNVHMAKVPLATDVEAEKIARGTPGFSGADLANLVNEAALMAARENKRLVDMDDFEAAKDKIMMGAERRSNAMTEEQKKTTAYHEAGHALVSLKLDGPTDPLHKITIIPRGRALGVTMSLPAEDRVTYDKHYLENQIAMLYGGRLAEELILGQMTTGASNDIEKATDLAKNMVTSWGMSKKLGPINYGENEQQTFMGRDIGRRHDVAEATASAIDAEVRDIIESNYKRAESILKKHEKDLHKLAKALLEYETLDRAQVDDLLAGKTVVRKQIRKKPQVKKASVASKKPTTKKKTDA